MWCHIEKSVGSLFLSVKTLTQWLDAGARSNISNLTPACCKRFPKNRPPMPALTMSTLDLIEDSGAVEELGTPVADWRTG